jgi:hypothetical protein
VLASGVVADVKAEIFAFDILVSQQMRWNWRSEMNHLVAVHVTNGKAVFVDVVFHINVCN